MEVALGPWAHHGSWWLQFQFRFIVPSFFCSSDLNSTVTIVFLLIPDWILGEDWTSSGDDLPDIRNEHINDPLRCHDHLESKSFMLAKLPRIFSNLQRIQTSESKHVSRINSPSVHLFVGHLASVEVRQSGHLSVVRGGIQLGLRNSSCIFR